MSVIADEADGFRLSKYKEHKRLLKKTHEQRDATGCIASSAVVGTW